MKVGKHVLIFEEVTTSIFLLVRCSIEWEATISFGWSINPWGHILKKKVRTVIGLPLFLLWCFLVNKWREKSFVYYHLITYICKKDNILPSHVMNKLYLNELTFWYLMIIFWWVFRCSQLHAFYSLVFSW